jgi:hypothetical protein
MGKLCLATPPSQRFMNRRDRVNNYPLAYQEICKVMTETYRKWGGIEAEETGMVNVSGEMTKAIMKVLQENDWLNEKGLQALEKPHTPSS